MITGKLYNWLKFIALVVLPALAALYLSLAGLWGLPSAEAVSGTIAAVDTFLGVILQISSSNYNSSTAQGVLSIHDTGQGKKFNLELEGDPEETLEGKDRVVFKVKKTQAIGKTRASGSRSRSKRAV
jgi:hypothetical protein